MNDRPLVAVARVDSYQRIAVEAAVRRVFEPLGGIGRFVKPGARVLLKPNLLGAFPPERAVTTHPEVVRAVAGLVQEAGGSVDLGDGPGMGAIGAVLKVSGLREVMDELGIGLADMDREEIYRDARCVIGKSVRLSAALREYDVVIDLAKAKTHVQMVFTGAVKNLYGLLPGPLKSEYHYRIRERRYLAEFILDLAQLAPITLALTDAVIAMEGEGPSSGVPRALGFLAASTDLVALDAVTIHAMNLAPDEVPVMAAALRRNMAQADARNVEVAGAKLEELTVRDFKHVHSLSDPLRLLPLPCVLLEWMHHHWKPLPTIDRARCVGCLNCMKGCPVKPDAAIDPQRKRPVNPKLCIKCYCCHEFCPVKAIDLAPTLLERFVMRPALLRFAQRAAGTVKGWFRR